MVRRDRDINVVVSPYFIQLRFQVQQSVHKTVFEYLHKGVRLPVLIHGYMIGVIPLANKRELGNLIHSK
ncbi:hypothetical protein B0F90DRAFT_1768576 [Multifurca ochricompacta]|uniref:Uncharacterized protein n=1 Tax=Multifurca ochricompacta TaxID=376703 RepID=A0AAD4LWR6_9AGAM|nr:hypothetical protein B0F90DRAFT_1768576 [Multifurca ochricompacta]